MAGWFKWLFRNRPTERYEPPAPVRVDPVPLNDNLCYECGGQLGRDCRLVKADGHVVKVHFECVGVVYKREGVTRENEYIPPPQGQVDERTCYVCDERLGNDSKFIFINVHNKCAQAVHQGKR